MIRWLFALLGYVPRGDERRLLIALRESDARAEAYEQLFHEALREADAAWRYASELEAVNEEMKRPTPFFRYREMPRC